MRLLIGVLSALICACTATDTDTAAFDAGDDASTSDPCTGEVSVQSGIADRTLTVRDRDDLSAIADCKLITGNLLIEDSELTNLDGLEKLNTIVGGLRIADNRKLTSIAGLRSLTLVNSLELENNPSLLTLAGLERLKTRESSVNERGQLEDAGWVTLTNNRTLESVKGLQSLDRVFALRIESNPSLTNLNGLESISYIFDGLVIIDNANLTDIRALLRTGCDELDCLYVHDNPKLPNCQAEALGSDSNPCHCAGNDEDAVCSEP